MKTKRNTFKMDEISNKSYEWVNSPSHYNKYPLETIDIMIAIWGKEAVKTYCEINAFKYRMRAGTKPGNSAEQDLNKETWYLEMAKKLS